MTPAQLRTALMDDGVLLVFATHLNEERKVRGGWCVTFDRRKGFHVVERKLKQLRSAVEREGGIYLLALKDDKIIPCTPYQENLVTELPEEQEQEIYGKLPRYDFTAQVQVQRLLKKIGYF